MRKMAAAAAVIGGLMFSIPGTAQTAGGSGMGTSGSVTNTRDLMSQEQFNKLTEYADRAKRLTKEDKAKGKSLEDMLAEDRAAATALTKAMPLSCEVADAMLIAQGPDTVDGKTVDTKTYEAACTNGMGYFLISRESLAPYGFSCFAADATRLADVAAGRKPGAICQLPSNADMRVAAGKVLNTAGISCAVRDYRWVGQNAANHTEFDEIACIDGKGYIMIAALPGAAIPVHVETCNQSAGRGLPCKLSDNGALPVTLKTFREALAAQKIACDATDQTTRVIGQENAKKRYVIEFQCSQQPKGLVAFIPLAGSTSAPFEAIDCKTAVKRGVVCALPGNK